MTSADVFGDMVDLPAPDGATPQGLARGPIKVQINEPHAEGPSKPASLAPEVSALLEVFTETTNVVSPAAEVEVTIKEVDEQPIEIPTVAAEDVEKFLLSFSDIGPGSVASSGATVDYPPPAESEEPTDPEPVLDLTPSGHEPALDPRSDSDLADMPEESGLDLGVVAEVALEGAVNPATPESSGEPPATPSGETLYGPYRLLGKIAVGGMAEVFKAKRSGVEGFEKVLAVKRILRHLTENKQFVDMFVDEAKIVSGLAHPNIVQIHDLGKIDKSYYIAMEYVHGRDLRTILRRAKERGLRLPWDLSILIASKVCSALEYAHRKKDDRGRALMIAHRDISPQNVLISFEGDVKLTDFGIAKAAAKATQTDRGSLRGKLLYMSPEQASGQSMDRRSDLFSLGLVFYEMLTESKPFLGGSESSILERVRECRIPPPRTLNPRIPPRLERSVMKALERDPELRYQDALEMYRDLDRILHERKPPTTSELSRFMEILFDDEERTDRLTHEKPAASAREGSGDLEIEFSTPQDPPEAPGEGALPAMLDPMSIQKLLKRFGKK